MLPISRKSFNIRNILQDKSSLAVIVYGGIILLWGLVVFFIPQLILLLLLLNLLFLVGVACLQLYSALLPRVKKSTTIPRQQAFVSIHIPTYNEPPDVVINTLKALQKLNYQNFEVIVLDNNTPDPEVWKPVAQFCSSLDDRFRFRHIDKLEGFKAGALNVCHQMTDPKATYLLVIDADYEVSPELLEEASKYFIDDRVALVQFPQAYNNAAFANRGLESEYNHFFEVYMNMANQYNCVLSTGTVSMIRKRALEQAGMWSDSTLTEDCELGLRLHQSGFRGVYVPKSLGKGLMPTDLKALKVQRERWVFGNMQTLLKFLSLPKKKLVFSQCIGIFTQLTAWFNFLMLPLLAAVSGMIAYAVSPRPDWYLLGVIGILSIWLHLLLKLLFFRLTFRHQARPWQTAFTAYLVHLGMAWEGATSWWRAIMGENIRFKRTNKFLNKINNTKTGANLLMGALLLLTAAAALYSGLYLWATLAFLAAPAFAAVFYLKALSAATLKITRQLSSKPPVATQGETI